MRVLASALMSAELDLRLQFLEELEASLGGGEGGIIGKITTRPMTKEALGVVSRSWKAFLRERWQALARVVLEFPLGEAMAAHALDLGQQCLERQVAVPLDLRGEQASTPVRM